MSSSEDRTRSDESSSTEDESSAHDPSRPTQLAEEANSPDMPIALAAGASVLYSWYMFYVQEDEMYGLFVGLWAPTLLTFADYLRSHEEQEEINEHLHQGHEQE